MTENILWSDEWFEPSFKLKEENFRQHHSYALNHHAKTLEFKDNANKKEETSTNIFSIAYKKDSENFWENWCLYIGLLQAERVCGVSYESLESKMELERTKVSKLFPNTSLTKYDNKVNLLNINIQLTVHWFFLYNSFSTESRFQDISSKSNPHYK